MAKKQDFSGINTGRKTEITAAQKADGAGKLSESLERTTNKRKARTTATPAEQARAREEMKTQGRKGCHAQRFNITITPTNYEFIKTVAKASGRPASHLISQIIDEYRAMHPELLEKAQEVIKAMSTAAIPEKGTVRNMAGTVLDYERAAQHMNENLAGQLHAILDPCEDQEFFTAYEKAHWNRFSEVWELSKINPKY